MADQDLNTPETEEVTYPRVYVFEKKKVTVLNEVQAAAFEKAGFKPE